MYAPCSFAGPPPRRVDNLGPSLLKPWFPSGYLDCGFGVFLKTTAPNIRRKPPLPSPGSSDRATLLYRQLLLTLHTPLSILLRALPIRLPRARLRDFNSYGRRGYVGFTTNGTILMSDALQSYARLRPLFPRPNLK